MTLLFLYVFIQASIIPQPINYAPFIISAVIGFIMWWIKAQMDRHYSEQKSLKQQVYQNRDRIAENALRDENTDKLFHQYKENMAEKNTAIMSILNEIKTDLKELRKEVSLIKK